MTVRGSAPEFRTRAGSASCMVSRLAPSLGVMSRNREKFPCRNGFLATADSHDRAIEDSGVEIFSGRSRNLQSAGLNGLPPDGKLRLSGDCQWFRVKTVSIVVLMRKFWLFTT